MKTLDCESLRSTYKSLEFILGLTKHELQQIFDSTDIPGSVSDFAGRAKELFFYIERQTHCQTEFDATYWFHCTRTWPSNTFDKGLLPLDQVIDQIWDFLFDLTKGQVTSQQWADFKHSIESSNSHWADLYRMKLANAKLHGGPHALLIKEAAIETAKSSMYWNYFEIPEIVDDISECCPYRIDLKHKFITNTVPCVVKFIVHSSDINALHTAVMYAYRKYRRLALLPACNHCYTARGTAVPPEYILKVEHIHDYARYGRKT